MIDRPEIYKHQNCYGWLIAEQDKHLLVQALFGEKLLEIMTVDVGIAIVQEHNYIINCPGSVYVRLAQIMPFTSWI